MAKSAKFHHTAGRSDPKGRSMITKFATVYAGHVDLPDTGAEHHPANERRYRDEHLASIFDKTEVIAKKNGCARLRYPVAISSTTVTSAFPMT
jgi:hypothetical protein